MSTSLDLFPEWWSASFAKPEFERMNSENVLKLDDKSFDRVIANQPELIKDWLRAIRPEYLKMSPEDHKTIRKGREVLVSTSKQCGYTLVPTFDKLAGDFVLFVDGESDGAKLFAATLAIPGKLIIYTLRNKP